MAWVLSVFSLLCSEHLALIRVQVYAVLNPILKGISCEKSCLWLHENAQLGQEIRRHTDALDSCTFSLFLDKIYQNL